MRNILATTLFTLTLVSGWAYAFGLGEIEISSALNQPLRAEIKLLSVREGETNDMVAKLASEDAFLRAGIDRPAILRQLRFTVRTHENGASYIAVTSSKPIVEPFLNFLVEVGWPRGRLVREYTLLLDPPVFMTQQAQSGEAPQAPVVEALEIPEEPAKPPSEPVFVPEPQPQAASLAQTAGSQAAKPAVTKQPVAVPVAPAVAVREYGPVKQGETLWSIAQRSKPSWMSVQQMVIAISRANPDAFLRDNINLLRKGAILRIPQGDTTTVTRAEAIKLVKQQTALWNTYRESVQSRLTNRATQQSEQTEPRVEPVQQPTIANPVIDNSDELKLLAEQSAATQAAGVAASAESATELIGLQTQLSLANEEVEAEKLLNEELQSRVSSLEQTVSKMERLITLRESELAELQNKLADDKAVQVGAPVVTETAPSSLPTEPVTIPEPQPVTPSSTPITPLPPTKSFVDKLLGSPIFLLIGAGVLVLLLAVIFMLVRRHRQNEDEDEELDLNRDDDDELDIGASILAGNLADNDDSDDDIAANFEDDQDFLLDNDQVDLVDEGVDAVDSSLFEDIDTEPGIPVVPNIRDEELDSISTVIIENQAESEPPTDLSGDTQTQAKSPEAAKDDTIAESDVYLAYGLFSQAEDLLKSAIKNNPDKVDYQVKLAETYYAAKNKDSFVDAAERVHQLTASTDPDTWSRIASMGSELAPENPLFGGDGQRTSAESALDFDTHPPVKNRSPELAATTGLGDVEELPTEDTIGDIEFSDTDIPDYDDDADNSAAFDSLDEDNFMENVLEDVESEPVNEDLVEFGIDNMDAFDEITQTGAGEPAVLDFDSDMEIELESFDIDDSRDEAKASEKPADSMDMPIELEQLGAEAEIPVSIEAFDVGDVSDANIEQDILSVENDELVVGASTVGLDDTMELSQEFDSTIDSTANILDDEFGLDDLGEVDTMLDLAKAYIDMGDTESAASALDEIVTAGNDEQKAEAKALLKQLS